jgi:hypothetical protein
MAVLSEITSKSGTVQCIHYNTPCAHVFLFFQRAPASFTPNSEWGCRVV